MINDLKGNMSRRKIINFKSKMITIIKYKANVIDKIKIKIINLIYREANQMILTLIAKVVTKMT